MQSEGTLNETPTGGSKCRSPATSTISRFNKNLNQPDKTLFLWFIGFFWDEIDFDTKLWNIPSERMKRKKAHVVPLSDQSLALLELMRPISGHSEFVFPSGRDPRKHTNPQTANTALKRMGFDKQLVAHGMRTLASAILNEEGFDPDVFEAALAHIGKNDVRNAYNRASYIERRKTMMKWWSEHIENAATGNMSLTRKKGLKLVSF